VALTRRACTTYVIWHLEEYVREHKPEAQSAPPISLSY
jgi:hypothetical protein